MTLDPRIRNELRVTYDQLSRDEQIVSKANVAEYYDRFRQRFGPERLASLDGETLLTTLKPGFTHDSLAYWLEFKNDDEFPAMCGGIAGGSAFKFGVFWRSSTGTWMAGAAAAPREVTVAAAVDIARRDRDQLVQAASLMERLPEHGSDQDYLRLQQDLDRVAPDVRETAWGHKYFCLLFPGKISDIHVVWHQKLQLIRLLQIPPKPSGRYVCEGRYVAIAEELGLPLHTASTVIYRRNGPLRAYWRVDVANDPTYGEHWSLMRTDKCVALGMPEVGDLSDLLGAEDAKAQILDRAKPHYSPAQAADRAQQLFDLAKRLRDGDTVLVAHRSTVLGVGEVVGTYAFDATSPLPHRRPVEWKSTDPWPLAKPASTRRDVAWVDYRQDAASLVEIELHLLQAPINGPVARLPGVLGRIRTALDRKGQVIIYGPPGTGKTFWALNAARELAARSHFHSTFDELDGERQSWLSGGGGASGQPVRFCTFHSGYGYEDFIEGYRPKVLNDQMIFDLRAGIFKELCADAAVHPDRSYYLVIDEINRGDVPRIFGELLTLLERDKRKLSTILPLSGDRFMIPENVYVLGTMNTADRSIALLDTALRRRFGFVELMPDSKVLGSVAVEGIPLAPWLDALNRRVCDYVGRDARNLQIGHAYLLQDGKPIDDYAKLARVLQDDILPLLEEYCYENYVALGKILGTGLVDVAKQQFNNGLFDPDRKDDLVRALLEPCPEIETSPQAVHSDAEMPADEAQDQAGESGVAI